MKAKSLPGGPFKIYAEMTTNDARMRELARVAFAKGLSQEALAKGYAAKLKWIRPSGANTMRHFKAAHPDKETVDTYAAVLDVPKEHLALATGEPLRENRRIWWFDALRKDIKAHFEPFAASVLARLVQFSDKARSQLLTEYALAEYRSRAKVEPYIASSGLSPGQDVLQKYLGDRYNLRISKKPYDSREQFLVSVFVAARNVLEDQKDVDTLLEVARSLAKAQGLDVDSMDKRLNKARSSNTSYFSHRARISTGQPDTQKRGKKP